MEVQAHIARFKKTTGRLPTQVELTKDLGVSPQLAVAELLKAVRAAKATPIQSEEPSGPSKPSRNFRLSPLQVGLYAISLLTFALSVYFTGLWFISMFSIPVAGAISVSMVSYMVLSPQAAMTVKGLVKIPLWGSFLIALVFSMGSTVAGQYNKLSQAVDVQSVAERATLELLHTETADLQASLEIDREQQAFHQATLESLASTAEDRMENYQYVATERNKVAELASRIEEREERLDVVRNQILEEIQSGNIGVVEERDDFFGWVAGLTGRTRQQIEFLIAALPAIFIDIIAALSLNLAIRQGALKTT